MWHKNLVEEEVNIEVLKIETSLMPSQSLEEDPHASIVGLPLDFDEKGQSHRGAFTSKE